MDHVLVSTQERVMTVRMQRPEKKNALTRVMYSALAEALETAGDDDAVRAVLLAGTETAFSSGNDVLDFAQGPPLDESAPAMRFLRALSSAQKPVVAAVNGVAIGIGATMLLHCDLVYAGEGTRFQLPFVNLGLPPEAGSTLILPQLAGHRRAAELLLLGDPFDAATAETAGLVTAVCPAAEVEERARQAALALAAKPPAALRLTKMLLKRPMQDALEETMLLEARHFSRMLGEPEAQEAFTAFVERRRPDFSRFS